MACMLGRTPSRAKRGMSRVGEDLRVLDAQAVVGPRRAGQHALERVEDERVGAVADGVHAHLEAARRAPPA